MYMTKLYQSYMQQDLRQGHGEVEFTPAAAMQFAILLHLGASPANKRRLKNHLHDKKPGAIQDSLIVSPLLETFKANESF